MKLDSARGLKDTVVTSWQTAIARPSTVNSAVHLSAQPTGDVDEVQRTLAVGIAPQGKKGYKLAVRIQRRSLQNSSLVESLMTKARGEVDVRYVGGITKLSEPWHRRRIRPLEIGSSVGHYEITAGTIGGFARDRSGGDRVYVLSNNHVLANER